ncbi:hypothetical protein GCM10009839_38160 [Catenulispora yoronensis]|uniref:Uncharacterized protein n=1 Tax=Catenulispora yoronensis TaxID=450799 RepID=A0ABP5FZE8_9ACTN
MFEAAVPTGSAAMPVKLPAPLAGTAEQAAPNGAAAAAPVMLGELLELLMPLVLPVLFELLPTAWVVEADVGIAVDLLELLLLHALAPAAIAAEHTRAATVLLRTATMISSLFFGCLGLASRGIRRRYGSGLVGI